MARVRPELIVQVRQVAFWYSVGGFVFRLQPFNSMTSQCDVTACRLTPPRATRGRAATHCRDNPCGKTVNLELENGLSLALSKCKVHTAHGAGGVCRGGFDTLAWFVAT